MLPDKAPTTEQEALAIVATLDRESVPPPAKEPVIKSYFRGTIVTWKTLQPNLPCNGPPGPKLFGWPLEMQNQIRIQKEKGGTPAKIIKHMLAKFLPVRIPQVDIYVLNRKMTGNYKMTLDNIGEVDNSPGNLIGKLAAVAANSRDIFNGLQISTYLTPPNQTAYLEFSFEVTGWDFIKELWDLIWSGSIEVDARADVHMTGYETEQWIVPDFDETFTVNAILPVDEKNWHAWE